MGMYDTWADIYPYIYLGQVLYYKHFFFFFCILTLIDISQRQQTHSNSLIFVIYCIGKKGKTFETLGKVITFETKLQNSSTSIEPCHE